MSDDQLEEFDAPTLPAGSSAPAPAAPPAYAYGPQPADPRLYRFFWCAMACLIGVCFPFTASDPSWKADTLNPALNGGPAGTTTFFGALIALGAALVAAQYWWCMNYRKVKLWPALVMLMIAVGSWAAVVPGFKAKLLFDWKDKDVAHAVSTVPTGAWTDVRFWNSAFTHIGSGWLLVLIGSTYFMVYFLFSFISALAGGGKKGGPASGPAGRRR